ncbi:hypothetical protein E2C01_006449 [Portunus trituberculatus]|uniref:Uncharacterized protein n=1 Tax=Portunus trituberculatus TaxID=210409 RepID=A0A5B7CY82_PORTR|nr:hypothetical protein [Portunus trituberculatus]
MRTQEEEEAKIMTPRKKNKKNSTDGEDSANLTKKRGRSKDNSSPPVASPPTVRRSQRRTLAQASPSQDESETTPKRSRQAGPSPETPSRVSPRGKRETSSPIPSRTSPRGDRRSLRGSSTESSASNVSSAAINCASAERGATSPCRRRTRRESNSSSVSATSDTSSITPSTPQRGRGSKRKVLDKSDKGEVESSKEANGPSPQYSPSTKKRRGRSQAEISPLTTNGKSEDHVRPRRRICKTHSPHKVLDGGVDEAEESLADGEEEDVKNSVDSTKKLENFKVENGNDASTETDDDAHVLMSANATCDGADPGVKVNSKDLNKLLETETCKDSKTTLDVTNQELSESTMIEDLVEKLLNRSTSVQSMNAPRFNKFLRQLLNHYCCLDTSKESKHSLCEAADPTSLAPQITMSVTLVTLTGKQLPLSSLLQVL